MYAAHDLGGEGVRGVVEGKEGEEGAVGTGRGGGVELGEEQPGQQPGGVRVAPLGEVDANPHRVFQGSEGEGPSAAGGVEEALERRPVEQCHPVGEYRCRIAVDVLLTGPGIELAQHGLLSGTLQLLTQRPENRRQLL